MLKKKINFQLPTISLEDLPLTGYTSGELTHV